MKLFFFFLCDYVDTCIIVVYIYYDIVVLSFCVFFDFNNFVFSLRFC